MLHSDFKTWAEANATLLALGVHVYPGIVPQNPTLPLIVYNQTAGHSEVTFTQIGGYSEAVLQLSCIAASYGAAKELAKALRGQLHGYHGTMGSTVVQGAFEIDPGEQDIFESETREYRVDLTFRFHYIET